MKPQPPTVRFISLFVPDLVDATRRYQSMLGVAPSASAAAQGAASPSIPSPPMVDRSPAPCPHPFASAGPVIFELGATCLALYQCDGRVTHPGDVGIGLLAPSASELAMRAAHAGGRILWGPRPLPADGRQATVLMLPDRHFFEVLDQGRANGDSEPSSAPAG